MILIPVDNYGSLLYTDTKLNTKMPSMTSLRHHIKVKVGMKKTVQIIMLDILQVCYKANNMMPFLRPTSYVSTQLGIKRKRVIIIAAH